MKAEVGLTALRSSALAGCSTWARPGSAVNASLSRMTLCTSVAMRTAGSFFGAPVGGRLCGLQCRPCISDAPKEREFLHSGRHRMLLLKSSTIWPRELSAQLAAFHADANFERRSHAQQ